MSPHGSDRSGNNALLMLQIAMHGVVRVVVRLAIHLDKDRIVDDVGDLSAIESVFPKAEAIRKLDGVQTDVNLDDDNRLGDLVALVGQGFRPQVRRRLGARREADVRGLAESS